MNWQACIGSTLLINSGSCDHLHIVCSDPVSINGYPPRSCLLLNVSTCVPKCDETCIFQPGQHPFISVPSFVYFRRAQFLEKTLLEEHVKNNVYKAYQHPMPVKFVCWMVANMRDAEQATGAMRQIANHIWDDHVGQMVMRSRNVTT